MTTENLHRLDFGPEDLPPISPLDLRRAWRAAHVAAEVGLLTEPGDIEGVSFIHKGGAESRFIFADLDAACWAAAVDRTYDLRSVNGVSLLFRLLALIELMAEAPWLRPYFSLTAKDGAALDPALLAAAASEPLSRSAVFNAAAFKLAMGIGADTKVVTTRRLAQPRVKQGKAKPQIRTKRKKG